VLPAQAVDSDSKAQVVVSEACDQLEAMCSLCSADSIVNVNCVMFCIEQLRLMCMNSHRRRYSSFLLKFAFLVYSRAPSCYVALCSQGLLYLPHTRTLRKLTAAISITPGMCSNEQAKFLTTRCSQLTERERYVQIMIDEIHVAPNVTFKSGNITGVASNSDTEVAHSIQAFMLASLFGSVNEMIALCPVKDLSAQNLEQLLRQAIDLVQACGFTVVCVISDNNQVNAKAFEAICGGTPPEGVCELCGKSSDSVLRAMLPVFVNIFLNNYTKLCNDKFNAKGGKKRKLKTLTG
jgi:hypothetical protein